jgi:NAD(P)-dependent dehydrogenase (short-subunit alcohol dehydrogenase family)
MSSRVAIVTGASRGIGKQLCKDLAGAGFDVVCAARSTRESPSKLPGSIDETADLVEAQGRRAMRVALDVRDEEAVAALADRVYQEWGRCDVLVNNAAVAAPLPALQDSTRRWRLGVDVNLNGPFYLMYYLCPRMVEAGGGRVINISSGVAVMPSFGRPNYMATKLGLEGLSEAMAFELSGRVAVNALRLDLVVFSEGFAETLGGTELPFEHPVIMSDAVLWLAEQPIDYTGKVLVISDLRSQGIIRPELLYQDHQEP